MGDLTPWDQVVLLLKDSGEQNSARLTAYSLGSSKDIQPLIVPSNLS